MSAAVDSQIVEPKDFIATEDYHFLGDNATVVRKCAFLELYREHGSIFHAAKLTSVNRKTVYRWMEADPQFAEAVADSKEDSLDDLETSVYKRAFTDSLLAMFYLKAHRHKFRDKTTVDITVVQGEIEQRMQQLGIRQLPATSTEFISTVAQEAQEAQLQPHPVQRDNQQKEDG